MKKLIAAAMTTATMLSVAPVHAATIAGRVLPGTTLTFYYRNGKKLKQTVKGAGYSVEGKLKSIKATKKGYMPLKRKVTVKGDYLTAMNFVLAKKGKGLGEVKGKVPQAHEGEQLILKQGKKTIRTYTVSGRKVYDFANLKPGYYSLYQKGNPLVVARIGITGGKTKVKNLDKNMQWKTLTMNTMENTVTRTFYTNAKVAD